MFKVNKGIFSKISPQEQDIFQYKNHYNETKSFVRSSIYWMVNSTIVDDLVQETYLKGWKNYKRFRGDSSFRTWIYRVAMNVVYDYLKKNREVAEIDENDLSSYDNVELQDLISKGLMKLSIDKREVFMLHYQVGATNSEISILLNIPEGTVKSRVFNAKKEFVKFLEKNGVRSE